MGHEAEEREHCGSRDGQRLSVDQRTLHTMLPLGYAAYARTQAVPDSVRRAVWAGLACRTARRGGPVEVCPAGHVERLWSNFCRHRVCPPCAWGQVEGWRAQQKARLLACEHDHVMCTRPHARTPRWLANVEAMPPLLFASVRGTLVELLGDAT
jgi:hypothetical protein